MENIENKNSNVNIGELNRAISAEFGTALLTAGISNLNKLTTGSLLSTLTDSYLLYRSISGHCHITQALELKYKPVQIQESIYVDSPREEVYKAWRNLQNLPLFMKHLEEVREIDTKRSIWKANFQGLPTIEWKAEILDEIEGKLLTWQSDKDSMIHNSGRVSLFDAPIGRGTEIHVKIVHMPPAGTAGTAVARVFNNLFERLIREDVLKFKLLMETLQFSIV
ncbi:MAG: SRPBCC family protein [Flavobacteriales bacterium]